MNNYDHKDLALFVEKVLIKIGYNPELAVLGSKVLLSADLRGVDSHGVARLSGYIRLWENGRVKI